MVIVKYPDWNVWILVTIQLNIASGGPAGGQTFETFDKQVLRLISVHSQVLVYRLCST